MTLSIKKKTLRKVVSSLTMLATVVSMSGLMALSSVSVASAAVVDGSIIKSNATNSDGTPTVASLDVYIVKIVGTKMFKRLILNPTVFTSYGHLNWGDIQTVSQAVMDTYTTSSLVRVDGTEKVYAMAPDGDIGSKSWVNLTTAQFVTEAGSDADSIYTINAVDGGNYTAVGDVTTVAELSTFYTAGTLPGVVPVPAGALAVALSASTPASMTIPTNSSVEFTRINLSTGSEAASVSSIKVKASGLGDSTELDDVTLYVDGAKVGTSKNINSSREAIFNFSTPIAFSANATKTLSIKATVAATGIYALGINAASDVTTGGSITGSFPVKGNEMSASAATAVGTVVLGSVNNTASNNNFGEDNVLLAGFDLTTTGEAALWESMRLRNGGTNVDGIVSNLKLLVDGVEVATAEPVSGDIDFAVGNYRIEKNDTVSVEVRGDIGVSNVNNTIALYIKNRADLVFVGEDYGFGVQLTKDPVTGLTYSLLDSATEGIVATLTTGDISIDMDKTVTPAKDVKAGDNDVILATLKITSNGEDATISQIVDAGTNDFELQGTGLGAGEIENVEMRDTATGAVYDILATRVSDTQWTLSMTDEIALIKGVTKIFQIRADMSDTVGAVIDDGDTVKVVVDGAAMSITGDVSNAAITNITPSSVTSAIATVKDASLDIATTSLNSLTVVPGAQDVVIYQASVKAGTADGVKLTSVVLTTNGAGILDDFTDSNISKIDLYLNGVLIKSLSNNIVESAVGTPGYITFSSLVTTGNANVIPAGATVNLIAKATFASTLTTTAGFSLEIDHASTSIIARSVIGNNAVAETIANVGIGSRTITAAAKGTLKVNLLTTNAKADQDAYILAGLASASDRYLAELVFTTANEPIIIKELRLQDTGTATSSDLASVSLVDKNGVVKATQITATNGDVVFNPLNIELPADQATSLFISITTKGINVDGDPSSTATHAKTALYNINGTAGVVAQGKNSGEAITIVANGATATAVVATTTLTVGAIPTAAETITIGTCVVTFSASADELNCADSVANVKQNDVGESTTTIANSLDSLTNVTDATQGVLTVGADTVTTTVFTAPAALTGSITFSDGTSGDITAVATAGVTANSVTPAVGEWAHSSVVSKTNTLTGSVLNAITNTMVDGTLTGGTAKIIGKYKVVFDNGSNRKTDNTAMEALMGALTVTVNKTAAVALTNVKLQIEGTSTKVTATSGTITSGETDATGVANWTAASVLGLAGAGALDGEVTLVITADVATTTDQYLQTSIADIDGSGSDDDFQFIGDGGSTAFTNMYLNVDEVVGGTLSN